MKLKVGLFGAIFNGAVVLAAMLVSLIKRGTPPGQYLPIAALLSLSGFAIYYYIVSTYVEKRSGSGNPVFDSLVGMLAELVVSTLAVVLYSLLFALAHRGAGSFAADLAAGIMMNLLWMLATFMLHILLVGNAAGLIGWYLLKKTGRAKDR